MRLQWKPQHVVQGTINVCNRWITPHLGADICVWGRRSCLWSRVYGGALNVNRHLGGGGKGYLPDPHGHGSNDTHLLGTLPGCRHDFCLENGCYNLLLQRNCQMSKQNREINNLHEGGKSSICITTHTPQIVLPDVFSLGSKKKRRNLR